MIENVFDPVRDRFKNRASSGALICTIKTYCAMQNASYRATRLFPHSTYPVRIRPTTADVTIARSISRHTGPAPEQMARALTWGADEKVLLILATAGWVVSRGCSEPLRRAGDHALLVSVVASLLPHGLKIFLDQTRPDRRTVIGHLHGVSLSGQRDDAFPSGHALHMGALASAASALPTGPRRAVRGLAVGLSLTRVVVLAHWASDVVVGFALGAALERALRLWTGYPKENKNANPRRFERICGTGHRPPAPRQTKGS